jgi:hypothetical protein
MYPLPQGVDRRSYEYDRIVGVVVVVVLAVDVVAAVVDVAMAAVAAVVAVVADVVAAAAVGVVAGDFVAVAPEVDDTMVDAALLATGGVALVVSASFASRFDRFLALVPAVLLIMEDLGVP